MKKFAAFIMAILMVSQTAYAETAKTDSYNIHFDTDVFLYNEKTTMFSTFTYDDDKYVPLRAISNFLGKEVSYNSAEGSINIMNSDKDIQYQPLIATEKDATAKIVDNKIMYNNVYIFGNESYKRTGLLNYDGNIYVPMNWLITRFGLEEEYDKVIKEGVQKNITNPVGVFLFKQTFYNNSTEENAALLEQIPANFQNDETIVKVKEQTEKQKKTAVGTKFIDFEMQTPEGKTVKLSDYAGKGKVVLVDFWASWCGPCRREMPNLVEAYAQYKGKNFEIVGVSLDQDAAAWKESIKKLNMTWPQMSDLKFWQSEGAQLYAVNSIPHTVLIDGDGTIIARGLHGEGLQAKLAEVVK